MHDDWCSSIVGGPCKCNYQLRTIILRWFWFSHDNSWLMHWLRLPRTGSNFKVPDLSECRFWQLLVPLLQRHFRGSWWTGQEYINQDLVVSLFTSKMAFIISFQYNAGEQVNIKMSFASRCGFPNKSRAIDCMLKPLALFKIQDIRIRLEIQKVDWWISNRKCARLPRSVLQCDAKNGVPTIHYISFSPFYRCVDFMFREVSFDHHFHCHVFLYANYELTTMSTYIHG